MKDQNDVLTLLAQGLEAAANEHTVATLGDRQAYLGMSDLARGLSCPRAVLADKLRPENRGMTLEKLLTLRRGHWLEHGIEEALSSAKVKFVSQLEIGIWHQGVPIKAHLDLVLLDELSQSVTVLELKSITHLRDHVYGSHEAQLYGQLGLLQRFWREPVFIVDQSFKKDMDKPVDSKPCSFAELVGRQLGIRFAKDADSVSICGFVLTVSPNGARAFGPYSPNDAVLDVLLETGQELWQRLSEIKDGQLDFADIFHQQGFSPLCDWCRHNRDCPKFNGPEHHDLEPELVKLADMKTHRGNIDNEIKEREDQLKAIAMLLGLAGQWINTNSYRFKVASQNGRVIIDQALLQANLGQLKRGDRDQLLAAVEAARKTGKPFERLHLSPIN